MYFLYGAKIPGRIHLVATFDSEEQLLAYVGWATLGKNADGSFKFEQGSTLAGDRWWERSTEPRTGEDPSLVTHNPSPSML